MVPEQKDEMEENCKLFWTMLMMMMMTTTMMMMMMMMINGGHGDDVVVYILYEARPGTTRQNKNKE